MTGIDTPRRPALTAPPAAVVRAALPLIVLVVLWAAAFLFVGGFGSGSNVQYILQTSAYLGIVATGQTIVVLMGGIDLSVPATIAMSAVVCAKLYAEAGGPGAIVLALAASAAFGVANGFGVSVLGVPPMVMTLASGNILNGVLLIYTNGQPSSAHIPVLNAVANDTAAGVPWSFTVWVALAAASTWLVHLSRTGRYVFALGNNPVASRASGVPAVTTSLLAYAACGLLAGVSGLVILGFTGTSSLTMGTSYQLLSIAAVVLGGTSILGGRGGVWGTVVGATLITLLTAILSAYDITEAVRRIVQGGLILALLLIYARESRR